MSKRTQRILQSKHWDQALRGETKFLRELPPPSGDGNPRSIISLYPKTSEGWVVELRSSHTFRKTIQWLILYFLLAPSVEKRVGDVLKILGASGSESLFQLTKLCFELRKKDEKTRRKYLHRISFGQPGVLPPDGERYLHSFRLRMSLSRWWKSKQRLPPKRYVGIGYTDQGSLGSGPSWKAQVTSDEDVLPEMMPILNMLLKEVSR
jgi:hypothetical protein